MCVRSSQIYGRSEILQNIIKEKRVPNFKPLVGIAMEHVVFIAKLPRSDTFLQSSSFCGRSVFICSAYVQRSSVSGTCMAFPVPIFVKKGGIRLREYLVKLFRKR